MILVVDNYDSFTWNLVHYLQELGSEVEVVRNDAISQAYAQQRPAGLCWAYAWAIRRSASISVAWSSAAG